MLSLSVLYSANPLFLNSTFELVYDSTEIIIEENNTGSFYGSIINTSSGSISIAVIKREIEFLDDWASSICLGEICYNQDIDTTSIDFEIGDSVSLGVLVWTNGVGSSSIFLDILNLDQPNDTETLELIINPDQLKLINNKNINPKNFIIRDAYPNPFNPITKMSYIIYDDAIVNIVIYDSMGRTIKKLLDKFQPAGNKSILWDGTNNQGEPIAAGIYLYSIQVGKMIKTSKVVYLK
tara:strand:+ start:307 stop:1017 length:711 start_codon:yes stop_codon:yes gene_type:complete